MKLAKKGFLVAGLLGSCLVFGGIYDQFEKSGVVWVSPKGTIHMSNKDTTQRIWLFNPSGTPIDVEITPSCGCTVVSGPKKIAAYAVAPLDITVDLSAIPFGFTRKDVSVTLKKNGVASALQLFVDVTNTQDQKK